MDKPGPLKPQASAVPYLGGVAVFAGVVVGATTGRPSVLMPLGGALLLGVSDDLIELPPGLRLFGQLGVGALVAVTVPLHLPGALGTVLTIVVTVLLINGVNLIDGLDMLAGGVVAVATIGFVAVIPGAGRELSISVIAALVGFLLYNRPPARIYLGDGGSYMLGAALTVLLAFSWAPGVATPVGTAMLALVAVVAAEVAFASIRRLRGGVSPLVGDRRHPYDRLVARGWSPSVTSLCYVAIQAVLVSCAVTAAHFVSIGAAVAVDAAAAAFLVTFAATTGALRPDEEAAR